MVLALATVMIALLVSFSFPYGHSYCACDSNSDNKHSQSPSTCHEGAPTLSLLDGNAVHHDHAAQHITQNPPLGGNATFHNRKVTDCTITAAVNC